ncbi:MAG: protein kinase [Acidobacteriota bacterium]|nr:protein kinase [Acidobacteriota bacterium]
MGEVFLAEDTRLRRQVALKVLPESIAWDKERLVRFEREAFAVSALNHPNILTIYEFESAGETHFLASEFIKGETLRDRMQRDNLSLSETLDLAIQITSALETAHEAKIIHRDIKPENIMIRHDGLVKVLDFGLAKLTENKEANIDAEAETRALVKTNPGVVMGTVRYMSPEQARGRQVDARTDIFSFGCVLYEMLTGRQPFTGETINHTIVAILEKEPPPLSHFTTGYPAEIERIIKKCLAKEADERYPSAKCLLDDLKELKEELAFQTKLERSASPDKNAESPTQIIKAATTAETGKQKNSIAVLPFANLSADAENEYFCDGLAEELLNALAKIEDLKVAARTSAFSFKGKNTNVSEIGKTLNVETVLEGSVRRSGERIRITVQLINASDGYHLWSERYDREMRDIFDVQDEITLAVVGALKLKLLGREKASLLKRYTDNIKAYQLYLWGRFHARSFESNGFREAIKCYQEAIAIDAHYAPAYAGLADTYTVASFSFFTPAEALPKAKEAAKKALEIDDGLAEAHTSLAIIEMYYDQRWAEAEREFKRAIELNPGDANAHNWYGWFLGLMGRSDESMVELKLALTLDPLSSQINTAIGNLYYWMRNPDRAIEEYRKVLDLKPNFNIARCFLAEAYVQKGDFSAALIELQKAWSGAEDSIILTLTGYTEAVAGNYGEAKRRLESLKSLSKIKYVPAFEMAIIYVGLGEKEEAFKWLEKAYQEHSVWLPWLGVDPKFDEFRSDPRFQDLLNRVGLPLGENLQRETKNEAQRAVFSNAITNDSKKSEIAVEVGNQSSPFNPKAKRKWWLFGLLGLILLTSAFFGYRYFTTNSKQIESIAVLPFQNESGNADNEYLSDGITESLIGSLSKIPNLNVKARSSVFRYKAKETDLQRIAGELNVQAVLIGRVLQRGEQLILNLELVDGTTENVIWSEQYNRRQFDLVLLQSEIARDVSNKLRTKLSGAEQNQIAKNYTTNSEAYQLYLKGRFFLNNGTRDGQKKGIEYFRQAINLDPNFALGYAGIADGYTLLGATFDASLPPREAMPNARTAAQKALEIDPSLSEAHTSLAWIKYRFDWDWRGAEDDFKQAIALNPNNAQAHHWYADYLTAMRRFDEALAEIRRARELDPFSLLINWNVGRILYFARRYDEALNELRRTLEMDQNFARTHVYLQSVYLKKGMNDEAFAELLKVEALSGTSAERITELKNAYASGGWKSVWQKKVEFALEDAKSRYVTSLSMAFLYTKTGDRNRALEWLSRAYEEREGSLVNLNADPYWDELRADLRFQDLLRRIGLPQ